MNEFALKFLAPVFVVALFFLFLSISQRNKKEATPEGLVLDYGWVFKGVAWLCLGAAVVFPVVGYIQNMRIHGEPGAVIHYVLLIGIFLLLALYLLPETHFVKYVVRRSKIYCESPWRKSRVIEVGDIEQVTFSQIFKHYKLKTKHGDLIKVYMFMNGVPEFLDFLEKELGRKIERYD